MAIEYIEVEDANGVKRKVAVDQFDTDFFAQLMKLGFSADGAIPTQVSSANPLPVLEAAIATLLGEAQDSPTAYTVLARLKDLLTGINVNGFPGTSEIDITAIKTAVEILDNIVSGNAAKVRQARDTLDFGGATPNALDSVNSAGAESGDISCAGKSKILLKVEYSANNVTAPFWIVLKDSNGDVGRIYSTKVTPANTGENDDIQETNYFHGEGITLDVNGATSFRVVLADTPTNGGSVSGWAKAV